MASGGCCIDGRMATKFGCTSLFYKRNCMTRGKQVGSCGSDGVDPYCVLTEENQIEIINWMTVIVSVIVSTITAGKLTKLLLDKMLLELYKSDDRFLKQVEVISIETLDAFRRKYL